MTKPTNPGNGNEGNEGEGNDDEAHSVFVVTEDEQYQYDGTGHIGVAEDGSLLVGKGPVAAFAAGAWLRAYVEPTPTPEPHDP